MDEQTQALVAECKREEESCLWTSTVLYEWHKSLRWQRGVFVVAPIVLGGIAGWQVIAKSAEWFAGLCALLAGLFPAIYKALDLDKDLNSVAGHASRFKSLQDRFRQCWQITAQDGVDATKAEFAKLMDSMEATRSTSPTAPEKYFNKARRKIESGHYKFGVDEAARASGGQET
jgi:hypothetical protein